MFETFFQLLKLYKKEAEKHQYKHIITTFTYYFFLEFFSFFFKRNRIKNFLRHKLKISFLKLKFITKDKLIFFHFLENYGLLIDNLVKDDYQLKNMKKGKTAIDIGANIGIVSIMLSKRYGFSKIISFEPSSDNFKLFLENVYENKCKGIIPIKKALSAKKSKTKLYFQGSGTHSIINKSKKFEITEVSTLDFELKKIKKIDFLKIDVDGPEADIIKGGKNTIKKIKKAVIEFSSEKNKKQILKDLEGFEINIIENHIFAEQTNL